MEEVKKQNLKEPEDYAFYPNSLKGALIKLLRKGDVDEAQKMFVCRHEEAMEAIREYNTSDHKIMERNDKVRIGKNPYETNKLPRPRQEEINETAVFFFLGNPIAFRLKNDKADLARLKPYFKLFTKFLESVYFNERTRTAKRLAGAETECAKLYDYYTDEDGDLKVRCQILANSSQQKLYTLFNRHGDMVAFAAGYFMQNLEKEVEEHFDVYTNKQIFECTKNIRGWIVRERENMIGKIPIIYYRQPKEWAGVQERIERDEWVDSKQGDTNEYFGDPYLVVSQEIASNRLAEAEEVGKVIAVSDKDAVFEFKAPPDGSDMTKTEKENLRSSILEATFTPDLTYKSIMGLGTLSGEAMRRVALPGYMKRANRAEIYNELFNREINLVIAILRNILYVNDSSIRDGLAQLEIGFDYQDPFVGGMEDNSQEIATLVGCGAMSIQSAVEMNRNVQDKELEMERIWAEKEREMRLQAEINAAAQQTTKTEEK